MEEILLLKKSHLVKIILVLIWIEDMRDAIILLITIIVKQRVVWMDM